MNGRRHPSPHEREGRRETRAIPAVDMQTFRLNRKER
jgi:hypothetical protein